ncbi:hypothetical protein AZL_020200 [Azospirillum sp. B510]|uniref:DUF4942 domain-containing protein n=1 Tax=Azospirillum sp. (strain B510) TaxID=137722 RepID=UPI0001C4C36F|nr:DUF4942 domain-containing protein [Azospirillum sp. B510]BAI71496.1 hypothetical protein AZL_008580 [Azospirillum sp. B510]BAI72658.1 hypothetical protein AZL_020200 [Azospirillum sp. B510]
MIEAKGTELIRKGSADEIVAKRNRALDLYTRGVQMLAEAVRVHKEVGGTDYPCLRSALNNGGYDIEQGRTDKVVEEIRRNLDGAVWNHIMGALGLLNLMDAKEVAAFRDQNRTDPAEVTRDNLVATFARLTAESDAIFKRGVINLFMRLDRKFASNPAYRLGDKLIFNRALSEYGGWNHHGGSREEMRDLDRIFHIVDEKPPKDHCGDAAAMVSEVSRQQLGGTVETEYFLIRTFKNCNVHVLFRRPDLVVKVNQIIADHFGAALAHETRVRGAGRRRAA